HGPVDRLLHAVGAFAGDRVGDGQEDAWLGGGVLRVRGVGLGRQGEQAGGTEQAGGPAVGRHGSSPAGRGTPTGHRPPGGPFDYTAGSKRLSKRRRLYQVSSLRRPSDSIVGYSRSQWATMSWPT